LSHLTRLTRLCIPSDGIYRFNTVQILNEPDALPSAGGSLRALEVACDYEVNTHGPNDPLVCIEALLPVAAGLESLDLGDSWMSRADAARLAAALPRDMARLHMEPRSNRHVAVATRHVAWALLPVSSLEVVCPPADLNVLAGASRLERLIMHNVAGTAPAAMAAALQALPRLRTLQLSARDGRVFDAPVTGGWEAPPGATAEPSDAFVAAVARLPSLQHLGLAGFHIGGEAKAALVEAAPRLSSLRLAACGLSAKAAARLAARLRAAAGRGPLSARQRQPGQHEWRRGYGYDYGPFDGTAAPLDVCAGVVPSYR
jgi:hypothetical protein